MGIRVYKLKYHSPINGLKTKEGGYILKSIFKLFAKVIFLIMILFIILTSIIAITKLSSTSHVGVDPSTLGMNQETYLRRYGEHLSRTTLTTAADLKQEIIDYYKTLLKGELGWTYKVTRYIDSSGNFKSRLDQDESIKDILKIGFSRSIKLLSGALAIALIGGMLKGIFDSKKGKKESSTIKLFSTIVGLSIPVIFLAPLLQLLGMWIRNTYGYNIPIVGYETIRHTILPIIALSILPTMYIARMTTVAMDEAYEEEYVKTAISKGSSKIRILWLHVFRNAIVEITGSLSSVLTIIISDLAIVEYLFEYKGITYMMLDYFDKGQSDAVTGLALLLCLIFLCFYLLLKILRYVLDANGRSRTI